MRARISAVLLALLLAAGVATAQDGKQLYDKYCAQCHGVSGDGEGHATGRVKPAPRDFTSGKYKLRTTPSGMLPTDEDLRRVIRLGLPYTSMPGWPQFTDGEVQQIIDYLKTFSEDFQDPEKRADPIDIPSPPPITEESITRGRTVYEAQGCKACHGDLGRGDGLSAPTLTDDWGDHIRAADMSQRWTFRGGPTRADMFRTFSTGLNGTPMPSYFDSVAVEDRWDLVNYMTSLGDGEAPNYASLAVVSYVENEIDISLGPELFVNAPEARFPLLGQIVEPGRNFYPSATSVQLQAVYNRMEIAFLLRWNDMRAETAGMNSPLEEVPFWNEDQPESSADDDGDIWGDEAIDEGDEDDFWGEDEGDSGSAAADGEFSDAVALQFPSTLPGGIRKPYFLAGDTQGPVDLWFLDLARPDRVRQFLARGRESFEPASADEFEVSSGYDNGEWYVIFKRALRSNGNVSFEPGGFVPIAFSVWDGFNRERGGKRALSSWFYVYVEPMVQVSAVGPMIRAALGALVIELLLIFWIRRRFASERPRPQTERGTVPQGGLAT
jgi:mono/diheme cytochrome c family protein